MQIEVRTKDCNKVQIAVGANLFKISQFDSLNNGVTSMESFPIKDLRFTFYVKNGGKSFLSFAVETVKYARLGCFLCILWMLKERKKSNE